jgi:hypothetical protein
VVAADDPDLGGAGAGADVDDLDGLPGPADLDGGGRPGPAVGVEGDAGPGLEGDLARAPRLTQNRAQVLCVPAMSSSARIRPEGIVTTLSAALAMPLVLPNQPRSTP